MSFQRSFSRHIVWAALLLLALVTLGGCATGPRFATLEARVVPTEPLALPPNAQLTVRLVDVTQPGAGVIAESTYTRLGRGPIPVTLRYASNATDADRAYALRAEIRVNRTLTHASVENVPVLTGDAPAEGVNVPVEAVRQAGFR